MTFSSRRAKALALLARTGIPRNSYEPFLFRLLWAYGLELPPPHFAPFRLNALLFGVCVAVPVGLASWADAWARQGHGEGFTMALGYALVSGLLFGLGMASWFVLGRKTRGLPDWEQLDADSVG